MRHRERRVGCKEERERERELGAIVEGRKKEKPERRANRIERVAGQGERRRRQVYSGDLDANERFEALFDIRHDFIKHSSNVQTLYIELYSRSLGRLSLSLLSPWRIAPAPRGLRPFDVCVSFSPAPSLFLSLSLEDLPYVAVWRHGIQ